MLNEGWEVKLLSCINTYDKNKDGRLSRTEFGEFIVTVGVSQVEKGIQHVIGHIEKIRHRSGLKIDRIAQEIRGVDNCISSDELLSFYKDAAEGNPQLVAKNLNLLGLAECVAGGSTSISVVVSFTWRHAN